ncbi:MAG: glycosyltransferase [Bacteroidales bacterium]|nr:glycosyltransferase [Bacteroidales bacterium]
MILIDFFLEQSLLIQIVIITLLVSFVVQMIQYWAIFGRMAFYRNPKISEKRLPSVSVVIAARDEYHNMDQYLVSVLEQDYPEFEVVVVNNSDDDQLSYYFLKDLKKQYAHLKHVELKPDINFFIGKKFPLSIGIKEAKYEHLLFIDADCKPIGKQWIRKMMECYDDASTEVVLGYGGFFSHKGVFNKFCHFDTLWVGMQYLSAALCGIPYMGVGRNLSYKKPLFFRENGFISHYTTPSGDDDIFVNRVATRKNCRICLAPDGITLSESKKTLKQWLRQKRRHFSASTKYKWGDMVMLTIFPMFQLLFFITLIWTFVALLPTFWWFLVPILFALRLFTQLFITKKCMNKVGEKGFLMWTPFFEILLMIVIPILLLLGSLFKPKKWK